MEKQIYKILCPDTHIYGLGINDIKKELYLDIDCIFNVIIGKYYKFAVSPSTIVFKNVWDLSIHLDTNESLIIDNVQVDCLGIPRNVEYVKSNSEYKVIIECLQGSLSFNTIGGYLIKREKETILSKEYFNISKKRSICFSLEGDKFNFIMTPFCENPGRF